MDPTTKRSAVTRQQLYEDVWRTPATKLAAEYGVRHVDIYAACDRHGVPRPSSGHWVRLRNGYVEQQPPLPPVVDPAMEAVSFDVPPKQATRVVVEVAPAEPSPPIVVDLPDTSVPIGPPHALTKLIRRRLREAKQDDSKLVRPDPQQGPEVRVARVTVDRAMAILDALLHGWERRGGTAEIAERHEHSTPHLRFGVGPDSVGLTLNERAERDPDWHPPKDWYGRPPSRPTGKLTIGLIGGYEPGLRSTWADGARQRLEGCVDSILEGIARSIEAVRDHRLDEECVKRQERRAAERRESAQRVKAAALTRRTLLTREVRAWQKARLIREYLDALRERDASEGRPVDERRARAIDWAARYADHVDPLVAGPPPTPDLEPSDAPLADVELTRAGRRAVETLGVTSAKALAAVTREQVRAAAPNDYGVWSEFTRVLEGLGYNVCERSSW